MTYDPNQPQQPYGGQQQPNQPQQPYGGQYQQPNQPQQPYGGQYQQPYGGQQPQYPAYGQQPPYGYAAPGAQAQLAGWGSRFVAVIIDGIILSIPSCIVMFGLSAVLGTTSTTDSGFSTSAQGGAALLIYLILLLMSVGYHVYFWTTSGQTIGHKVLGIRVVREDGQPISAVPAIIRYVGYTVNTLPLLLGWLWPLWDAKNQGFHDKMAGTIVVNAK